MFSLQFLASGSWNIGALQLNSPLWPYWPQAVFRKLLKFIYCAVFCFGVFWEHTEPSSQAEWLCCAQKGGLLQGTDATSAEPSIWLDPQAALTMAAAVSASGQVRPWANRWRRPSKSTKPSHPPITPRGTISADWCQPAPSSLWPTPRDGTLPALSSTSSVFLSHPAQGEWKKWSRVEWALGLRGIHNE